MNTFFKLILLILLCFIVGCKSITENIFYNNQIFQVEIGSVGIESSSILKSTFNSQGFLNLNDPIKLEVNAIEFTNKTFKNFTNAKTTQSSDLKISYEDSLENKPRYLSFRIADVLGLIQQSNSKDNQGVKSYLETNKVAGIITSVSIAFPEAIVDEFLKAESIYLVQSGVATYHFEFIQKGKDGKAISFNDGVTIDYKLSKPCWKKERQNKNVIAELTLSGDKCSFGTYSSPRFIKTEEDYFKF